MGRPRKVIAEQVPGLSEQDKAALESAATGLVHEDDGSVTIPGGDIKQVYARPAARVSLANPQFDPFAKHKTDEKRFYYRAINTRPHNLRKREAEGYETIKGSEYGDLVLAKMPKDLRQERVEYVQEKTVQQHRATAEQFKEDAAKNGVKTFKE